MDFGIEQAYEQVKDAVKVSALSQIIEEKFADNQEKFMELIAKPMGVLIPENTRYSWENMKATISKKLLDEEKWKSFILESVLGIDKDSMIYRFVVGQPVLETHEKLSARVGKDRMDKNGNVFFPNCGINDFSKLFSAPKDALNAMKEIRENFAFASDSPLVLPAENAAAYTMQSLIHTMAKMAEPHMGEKQFPQIVEFDDISDNGELPAKGPNHFLQFVMMPDLPYDNDGVPDKKFLDKLVAFREKGGLTMFETTQYLAYADVYKKKHKNPEKAFEAYGMKPTPLMRKAVIDIHNATHMPKPEDNDSSQN